MQTSKDTPANPHTHVNVKHLRRARSIGAEKHKASNEEKEASNCKYCGVAAGKQVMQEQRKHKLCKDQGATAVTMNHQRRTRAPAKLHQNSSRAATWQHKTRATPEQHQSIPRAQAHNSRARREQHQSILRAEAKLNQSNTRAPPAAAEQHKSSSRAAAAEQHESSMSETDSSSSRATQEQQQTSTQVSPEQQ